LHPHEAKYQVCRAIFFKCGIVRLLLASKRRIVTLASHGKPTPRYCVTRPPLLVVAWVAEENPSSSDLTGVVLFWAFEVLGWANPGGDSGGVIGVFRLGGTIPRSS